MKRSLVLAALCLPAFLLVGCEQQTSDISSFDPKYDGINATNLAAAPDLGILDVQRGGGRAPAIVTPPTPTLPAPAPVPTSTPATGTGETPPATPPTGGTPPAASPAAPPAGGATEPPPP